MYMLSITPEKKIFQTQIKDKILTSCKWSKMLAEDPMLQIGIDMNFVHDWLRSIWQGWQGICRWSCHYSHQWPLRTDEFADAVPLPAGANERFTIWVILVLPQENFKAILLSGNMDLHKFVKALAFLVYIQSRIQEIMHALSTPSKYNSFCSIKIKEATFKLQIFNLWTNKNCRKSI